MNGRYDEVSARDQVPLSDVQPSDATTDNLEDALHPNRDSSDAKASRISLSMLIVDLASMLKCKYFT